MSIEARLAELGLTLPEAAAPVGAYVPWVIENGLVVMSGQITMRDGAPQYLGKLGQDIDIETGQAAARLCAINLLSQLKVACGGDLNRVRQVVRLGGFVNCIPEFIAHAQVINGASELMVDVFGDKGRHARAAVGCASLPLGVSVEVEGLFAID
ncbi:MAG: RidA family protein [Rhodospirillum sp.]|nr:RidA family protein [Rhodospirillum sp.]MCF8491205.1 RidA family protein [Rhodospirillum sp.]MCF8503093.1 RidA family protein [Rhodospirillum sp.]